MLDSVVSPCEQDSLLESVRPSSVIITNILSDGFSRVTLHTTRAYNGGVSFRMVRRCVLFFFTSVIILIGAWARTIFIRQWGGEDCSRSCYLIPG